MHTIVSLLPTDYPIYQGNVGPNETRPFPFGNKRYAEVTIDENSGNGLVLVSHFTPNNQADDYEVTVGIGREPDRYTLKRIGETAEDRDLRAAEQARRTAESYRLSNTLGPILQSMLTESPKGIVDHERYAHTVNHLMSEGLRTARYVSSASIITIMHTGRGRATSVDIQGAYYQRVGDSVARLVNGLVIASGYANGHTLNVQGNSTDEHIIEGIHQDGSVLSAVVPLLKRRNIDILSRNPDTAEESELSGVEHYGALLAQFMKDGFDLEALARDGYAEGYSLESHTHYRLDMFEERYNILAELLSYGHYGSVLLRRVSSRR